MAERKIPYIIELTADDKKLRQQMSGWNWEEIMGQSKGKSFKDTLVKDTKEAKQEIVKTLGGMGLDWGKILGEKELSLLEKKVGHIIKANKDKLSVFANEGDTAGIQATIDLVSALGNELKGLGSSFDASGIARNLGAFMKVLTPLSEKFNELAKEPEKVSAAFDKLLNSNVSSGVAKVSQRFTIIGDEASKAAVKTNQAIQEMEKGLSSIDALFNKEYSIKLNADLDKQFIEIEKEINSTGKEIRKLTKEMDSMSVSDKNFEPTRNKLVEKYIRQAELYRKQMMINEKYASDSPEDKEMLLADNKSFERQISEIRGKITSLVEDARRQIDNISKSTKTTKDGINIPIKLPTQNDLIKTINDYVAAINKSSAINSIKIGVDKDVYSPIEDKQKRAYKDNPVDDDVNTTKIVEQTENRFDRIATAIEGKQSKILNDTKVWRNNMLEQFKFKSGDFEFKFNDTLIESLQSLFDDYSLKVNIDPQYLADQIKTVLSDGGVSLGGGTANIDANSMAMAIATGLRSVLTGEISQTLISSGNVDDGNNLPEEVSHITTEIEQTGRHLDLAEDYVKDVVEKLKAVAKYATRHMGTDKDTKGAITTRDKFDLLGIDLKKVKTASDVGNDAEIVSMLENSLLQKDEFGKLKGSTVIDELSNFKGSSSKTISAFLKSMDEVFFMLQEDTQSVEEWTRRRQDKEIFDSARGKAKAASGLRDVRSTIRQGGIPDTQSIETAISLMTAIGQNTDDLQALRSARETLADKTDDASIEEFKTAADTFYKSSTKTFWDLKRQAEDTFKGTVYLQGKNGKTHSKNIDSYKQLSNIKDDAVIVDVQVSSSLNNVALGTVKSKYNNRTSQAEEKRLMRDATRPDFIIPRQYEKDILNKTLTYEGFKPQGVSTQVNLDASLEANEKKKQSLLAEIQAKEEEKKSLDTEISILDNRIKELTEKNKTISQKRRDSAKEKVLDFETTQQQLSHEILMLEEKVGNGKTGEEQRIGSLTKDIEEQLRKRASAEEQLAQLSELDVERKKKELGIKISELEIETPKLQDNLTKAQARYNIEASNRVMAQVDANKASAALKAIPNTKKNEVARAEAENTLNKAQFALTDAIEKVNEASKDVDFATQSIERNEKQISNLKSQISKTTLESIRKEQLNRIRAINDVITSLENEFETLIAQKNAKETTLVKVNKELEKSRNVVALKTERELNSAISERDKLKQQQTIADSTIKGDQKAIGSLEQTNQRVQAEIEYNKLLEKSLMLQGSINKMAEDEEPEKKIEKKRKQLEKVNNELTEAEAKVQALGGFLGQGNEKEYSDGERKTYALNELKKIEDDLITVRAQKRVSESRISKKDREIADLDKWGLGAGIGASELGRTKGRLTSEFMDSDYVQSQVNALREKTKAAITESENESRKIFDKKVAMAMEHLNWNPLDQTQVQKFLNTKHGQQLSNDFASEVDTNTTNIWKQYDEYRKDLLTKLKTEFQDSFKTDKGVLTVTSKVQDESGAWINEIVEVHVKEALRARLEEEKRILETRHEPIQGNIDRLEVEKATAIEYGGVSDKELLSGKIIEDQIRKEERLAELKEKRAVVQQKLNDLENAGVEHSDDTYKSTKKDLNSFNKEIERYEMLIQNRQKLVQMRYDESKEPTYTDEEKQLHFTNQIITYNQRIEDSLVKQKALTDQIASATGDEKVRLQRQLSIEEANVTKWREKIPTYESKLNKLQISKSKDVTSGILPNGGILGSVISAISEVVGGIGNGVQIDSEDLAKETTLKAILEVLGGVPSGDDGYGLGRGKKVKNLDESWKEVPNYKNETTDIDTLKHKAIELKSVLDTLYDEGKVDTVDFLKTQTELSRVMSLLRNKVSKDNPSVYGEKGNKESAKQASEIWKNYLTSGDSKIFDNLDNVLLSNISKKAFNSRLKKISSDTTVQVEDTPQEKPVKNKTKKTKKNQKVETISENTQPKTRQATGGLIQLVSRLATENTLLQVLSALQTVGTTGSGQTAPTAAGDLYDQFKALLLGSSVDDHERLAFMNSKTGEISGSVIGTIANISEELINAWRAKYPNVQGFDTQIHTHGNDTGSYFSTEDYQQFSRSYEEGIKKQVLLTQDHVSVLDLSAVKSAEEVQALMDELIKAGDNANAIKKVFENNKSGAIFETAKFDGLNVNSLVKMLGTKNTRQRGYSNVSEINSVDKQRNKIISMFDSEAEFDNSNIALVQQYNNAVENLNTTYETFSKNRQSQNAKEQKELSQQAFKVQSLGKYLMSSINQAQQLKQYVDQSGTYMKNGEPIALGGVKEDLSVDEINNLDSAMRNYVQNTLGQANIENVKFNNTKQQLIYTFRTSKDTVADMVVQYNAATNALYAYNKQERESLTGLKAFVQGFQSKLKSITQYMFSITSITRVWSEIRQGIQYVREIDSALTELKKVTDETEESYDKFLDTASKTAGKIGSTIKEVVSSTADFARLGYSMEEAHQMAETAQVLMNVSEFTDISTATDSLISSIQAFKYTAEESMDVVDILNTIGNNYAISTADLATSLTKSSGSLVAANGTLEEAVALTATANTIIQDADVVGTALKTVAMRLRGTSTEELEEEGLDTDGAVTSSSKLRSKIKGYSGVDILTDTGAYKSTYQILSEIADVWETMNDMDQAALLELLAGKRAGSVMSAILQNPETLKNAFESASDATGSALTENEKYLDSIQGKIDLLTNAIQTMWSNTLNDGMIKGIVEFGTELVKIIDKIGLIPSLLGGVFIYLTAFKKNNPVTILKDIGESLLNAGLRTNQYAMSLKGLNVQQQASKLAIAGLNQEQIKEQLIKNNNISTDRAELLATEAVTAAKMKQSTATAQQVLQDWTANKITLSNTALDWLEKQSTDALTRTKLQEALASGAITKQDYLEMAAKYGLLSATEALKLGVQGLTATIKASMASNPIGWIMLAISAVVSLVTWISSLKSKTEKLEETLSDLNSEINTIKGEIDSLNSELETTRDRMAELEAMPYLSFIEEEELEKLKGTTAELERQLQIKESLAASKKNAINATAKEYIDSVWNSTSADKAYYTDGAGVIHKDEGWNGFWNYGKDTKEALDYAMDSYQIDDEQIKKYDKVIAQWDHSKGANNTQLLKDNGVYEYMTYEDLVKARDADVANRQEVADSINMIFADENFENLEYGDDEKINAFLDEFYAYQLKWQQVKGSYVKSDAISTMFDATSTKEMQQLGKELQEIVGDDSIVDKNQAILDKLGSVDGVDDDVTDINKLSSAYNRLGITMETVGVTAQDIADYFILDNGMFNSSTVEGIAAQYQIGINALEKFKKSQDILYINQNEELEEISWEDLFDFDGATKEATANVENIAKVLKGADEETREQFSRLVKSVAEGKLDFDQAMKSFGLSGTIRGFELVEEQISAMNTDIFKDLSDELSGVIDTFSEFSAALESVADSMDILNTAQTQYNNSGSVSVKTALELINTTDRWNDILTIEEGNIKLVDNAEEILIQTKLDHVRANLEAALSTVRAQIAQIEATGSAQELATTLEESTNMAVISLAENMAYLSGLIEAFVNGNWSGAISAAETARSNVTYKTTSYRNTDSMSTSDLEKKESDLEAQLALLDHVGTTDKFKNNYDFDKTPGDKYDDDSDSSSDDAFQKAMDYWENRIGANQARYEQLQNEIDLIEKQGGIAGEEYYKEQIKLENKRLKLLEAQKAEAKKYLGTFKTGSDEWWEAAQKLNDIEGEIDSVTSSIQDLNDAMNQIKWTIFDEVHERFDDLIGQLKNVREALSVDEDAFFDDEGNWAETGVAVLGTYIQEIEYYKNSLANVEEELKKLQKVNPKSAKSLKAAGFDSEQEYYDKLQELIEKQNEYTLVISDSEQAVVDMYESQIDAIEEYTDKLVDSYNEYIDVLHETLDAERD